MRWSYWQAWASSGTDWADLAWAYQVGISNAIVIADVIPSPTPRRVEVGEDVLSAVHIYIMM